MKPHIMAVNSVCGEYKCYENKFNNNVIDSTRDV